jgi:hypothetical protein
MSELSMHERDFRSSPYYVYLLQTCFEDYILVFKARLQ